MYDRENYKESIIRQDIDAERYFLSWPDSAAEQFEYGEIEHESAIPYFEAVQPQMCYYPVVRNWRKIKPHLNNPDLQKILLHDFNLYTTGCWGLRFREGQFPRDFETYEWSCERRGRHPEYWKYVKRAACHWLVNFNRYLAELVEPRRTWWMLHSNEHSTVWDGKTTLFDFNFLASGIPPQEPFRMATQDENALIYSPDEYLPLALPEVDYARKVKGLRIIPCYDQPA